MAPDPDKAPMTEPYLIYDGDCPFCSQFARLSRLKDSIGPVRIINARNGGPEVDAARAAGFVIDEGMILAVDGQIYYGAECLNRIALLSSHSTAFNKLVAFSFRSPTISRLSYPVLKLGRNLVLRLMGIRRLGF